MKSRICSTLIIFGFSIFILAGCAGKNKTLTLGTIDKDNKTITIDYIGIEIFDIKVALIEDGWSIKTGNQGTHETGRSGQNIDTRTIRTFDTKYRMRLSRNYRNGYLAGYNIVIIDNEKNIDILSIVGHKIIGYYSAEDLAEHLITELQKIGN
jgi:hypothetical protein